MIADFDVVAARLPLMQPIPNPSHSRFTSIIQTKGFSSTQLGRHHAGAIGERWNFSRITVNLAIIMDSETPIVAQNTCRPRGQQ